VKLKELGSIEIIKICAFGILYVTFADEGRYYHNSDGPAVINEDGRLEYWIHGKFKQARYGYVK